MSAAGANRRSGRSAPERKMRHLTHWAAGRKPGHSIPNSSAVLIGSASSTGSCRVQRDRPNAAGSDEERGNRENERDFSMEANTVKVMVGRLSRLGVSGGRPSGDAAAMADLEMELALLREEDARVKVERHRAPDAGRVIERMRHLGQARQVEQLDADGAHGS